jgi:hypothetical protein
MSRTPSSAPRNDRATGRVLAVTDWSLDPQVVVTAMGEHHRRQPSRFGLVVPAGLHGLDWIGDPYASRPCAERQLHTLDRLCHEAGIPLETVGVGEPEPPSAIDDVLLDWPAQQILLFGRNRRLRFSNPFALVRRVERMTGLPVTRFVVPPRAGSTATRGWLHSGIRCRPSSAPAV